MWPARMVEATAGSFPSGNDGARRLSERSDPVRVHCGRLAAAVVFGAMAHASKARRSECLTNMTASE